MHAVGSHTPWGQVLFCNIAMQDLTPTLACNIAMQDLTPTLATLQDQVGGAFGAAA